VRRRELVMMGLAGGLVPSPSALVVLLGAIAVGRVPFGVALVVAYGIGLAATLVIAGLLMVRFERGMRGWSSRLSATSGARLQVVSNALPLVSGFAIAGAGILLLARSIGRL
jgi:nickel/cobalt transporter (NicO) family protein